jgi:hypothetical protein
VPRERYLNWEGFPRYANDPTVPWHEKTQAFFVRLPVDLTSVALQ